MINFQKSKINATRKYLECYVQHSINSVLFTFMILQCLEAAGLREKQISRKAQRT